MMQFDHFNSSQDDGLISIEDLKALRLRKKKIEMIRKLENISWRKIKDIEK